MSKATSSSGAQSVSVGSLLLILLLAGIWGLSIPFTKLGLESMPPMTLTALRFVAALPPLFLLSFRTRVPLRALPRLAGLGVVGIGVGQLAQTLGVAGTSASIGAILSATIPLFVVLFAILKLRQRVTARQAAGLGAAFLGIAVVALGTGGGGAEGGSLAGAGFMLLSSVAVAFYYVWSVTLARDFGTPAVAAWSTLAGLLALAPFALGEMAHQEIHLTLTALAVACYLGFFVTAAGLYLWLHLLKTVPAVIATTVQYLHPVIGILAGALMFGEPLGAVFIAGVVLILGGLALVIAPTR